ncbi:MAG: B12-binding domain-containing radical SAM protein [Acidobacteria bacterium]|nr:B12-binding domain-containing radical SAM protein [Acidobacteriota bacterium]MBI3423608.1 B12-binding domain-containing radical SAM protein [Acidobacteriota bacterium]
MEASAKQVAPNSTNKLRIKLLSPRGPLYRHRGGIWKKTMRYAPLTLTTLAALIPPDIPHEVSVLDEGIDEIRPDEIDADLVGISAITGTAPRAYEIAAQLRKRNIPVVLGGVHPTLLPHEAQQHADALVVGYAEESWPQLLRDFVAGRMQKRYDQSPTLSLANLPLPKRELFDTNLVNVAHTIEATRGCIYQCDFCVVPAAWGKPIQKPVADVIADIRQMGARRLIFLDLNLIADLEYAKELFTALIPLKLKWGGLATTTIAWDDELLDLAARSGCRGLLLGFESLSQASLDETKKSFNMRRDYHFVVRQLHARGIAIMGCFVFGFDHDTLDTFDETVDFVMEAKVDLPRYAIQVPFPGTGVYKRLLAEGRINTQNWSLYDGQHVVYQPKQMTAEQLLQNTGRAWRKTYSYGSILKRLAGARTQLPVALSANLGYRFYAYHLDKFYTCDWQLGLQS